MQQIEITNHRFQLFCILSYIFFIQLSTMASWDNRVVTNEHLLPYVDSNTAPPDIKAALQTLPFERNIFKVSQTSPCKLLTSYTD
jgi:hypothetical protein